MAEKSIGFATREEIERLPLLARVAFAARCARRVLPLFEAWTTVIAESSARASTQDGIEKLPESARVALAAAARTEELLVRVRRAVLIAEEIGSGDEEGDDGTSVGIARIASQLAGSPASFVCGSATDPTAYSPRSLPRRPTNITEAVALAASGVAYAAAHAAYAAYAASVAIAYAGYMAANATGSAASAADRAVQATAYAPATAREPCIRAMRAELELLGKKAQSDGWKDDTPVPPESFGLLWPGGAPEGWPVAGEQCATTPPGELTHVPARIARPTEYQGELEGETGQLAASIVYNESVDEEKALRATLAFWGALSNYNRACGGGGVFIDHLGDIVVGSEGGSVSATYWLYPWGRRRQLQAGLLKTAWEPVRDLVFRFGSPLSNRYQEAAVVIQSQKAKRIAADVAAIHNEAEYQRDFIESARRGERTRDRREQKQSEVETDAIRAGNDSRENKARALSRARAALKRSRELGIEVRVNLTSRTRQLRILRESLLSGNERAASHLAGMGESGLDVLCEVACTGDATARNRAVSGLGKSRDRSDRVFQLLRTALDDAEAEVRMAACGSLRGLGPRSVSLLEDYLNRETDMLCMLCCVDALFRIEHREANTAMEAIERASDSERVELRETVATRAFQLGDRAKGLLLKALEDEEGIVREGARRSITRLKERGMWTGPEQGGQ